MINYPYPKTTEQPSFRRMSASETESKTIEALLAEQNCCDADQHRENTKGFWLTKHGVGYMQDTSAGQEASLI